MADWCSSGSTDDTLAVLPKIWALCETQTLTWNFPSSSSAAAAADIMPVLLFFCPLFFSLPRSSLLFYSLSFILHYLRASALSSSPFLPYDCILIPPNIPQRTTTTCLFVTNHRTVLQLCNYRAYTRCSYQMVSSFSSIFSSAILHILWSNIKREPVLWGNSPFQAIFLHLKWSHPYVFTSCSVCLALHR